MKFNDAYELLFEIQSSDLYCPELEIYAFEYNDKGAVCWYYIYKNEAIELAKKVKESDEEYWGAFLGIGGQIIENENRNKYFDDPTDTEIEDWVKYEWIYCSDVLDTLKWGDYYD